MDTLKYNLMAQEYIDNRYKQILETAVYVYIDRKNKTYFFGKKSNKFFSYLEYHPIFSLYYFRNIKHYLVERFIITADYLEIKNPEPESMINQTMKVKAIAKHDCDVSLTISPDLITFVKLNFKAGQEISKQIFDIYNLDGEAANTLGSKQVIMFYDELYLLILYEKDFTFEFEQV